MTTKNFINKKPFLIAEISGNHGGKLVNAKKLIKKAKESGFDAVKLQTYTPDMMTLKKQNIKLKMVYGDHTTYGNYTIKLKLRLNGTKLYSIMQKI